MRRIVMNEMKEEKREWASGVRIELKILVEWHNILIRHRYRLYAGGKIVDAASPDVETGEICAVFDSLCKPEGITVGEVMHSWIVENGYIDPAAKDGAPTQRGVNSSASWTAVNGLVLPRITGRLIFHSWSERGLCFRQASLPNAFVNQRVSFRPKTGSPGINGRKSKKPGLIWSEPSTLSFIADVMTPCTRLRLCGS